MAFVHTMTSLGKVLKERTVVQKLTSETNTYHIDPTTGSYFVLNDIDDNINITIGTDPENTPIYLKLNFAEDDIVVRWPNNIRWYEISPPLVSSYEDLNISLVTFDGGLTYLCYPLTKTRPLVDLSNYMANTYPATYQDMTQLPEEVYSYISQVRPTSFTNSFYNCKAVTFIDTSSFDFDNVNSVDGVFYNCNNLNTLDVSDFDVSRCTTLSGMFYNCSSLTSIDASSWDTSNVTNLSRVFEGCSSLTSLNAPNWDTSNVTGNLYNTFASCSSLTSLDLSGWDTSSLESMQYTFGDCRNLVTLDLSNWTSPSTCSQVFYNCGSLKYLILDSNTCKFKVQPNEDCKIIVPLDYITAYTGNSSWSNRTNKTIVPIEAFDITRSNGSVSASIDWDWIEDEEYNWPGYKWVKDFYPDTYNTITQLDSDGREFLSIIGANYNCNSMFAGCSSLATLDLSNVDFTNVTSFSNAFDGDSSLTTVNVTGTKVNNTSAPVIGQKATTGISDLDISIVTNCSNMFKNNTALTTVDLSTWDTSAITNTSSMFNGCSNLTSLDISGLDLSAVTSCGDMFKNAPLTTGIDVTNTKVNNTDAATICQKASNTSAKDVDISLVTNMSSLFSGNTRLTTIDISDWDVDSVTNTSSMFNNCSNLTTIDISGCDFRAVTTASNMFNGCSSLNSVDVTGTKINNNMVTVIGQNAKTLGTIKDLNVASVTSMANMFQNNTTATTLDLSSWDVDSVTNTNNMFNGCSNLTSINMSGLDFSSVTSCTDMFKNASVSNGINVTNTKVNNTIAATIGQKASNSTAKDLDISIVTNMSNLFNGNTRLTSLDISDWSMDSVTNTSNMFNGCSNLNSLDLSGMNLSSVTTCTDMFKNVPLSSGIDVTGTKVNNTIASTIGQRASNSTAKDLDVSIVTNMSNLFSGNTRLTSLDLSGWNTSSVTNTSNMFKNCSNVTTINLSNVNLSSVTNSDSMFSGCNSLATLNVNNCKVSNNSIKPIVNTNKFTSGLDTSAVTSVSGLFSNRSDLTSLDLSGWDTSHVTNMSSMLSGCSNLESLNLSGWNFSVLTSAIHEDSGVDSEDAWIDEFSDYVPSGSWYNNRFGAYQNFTEDCDNLSYINLANCDLTNFVADMWPNDDSAYSDYYDNEYYYREDEYEYRAVQMFLFGGNLNKNDVIGYNLTNTKLGPYSYKFFCNKVTNDSASLIDISGLTSLSYMFKNNFRLVDVDLSDWDISNITKIHGMFEGCSNLESVDLSGLDFSNITQASYTTTSMSSLYNVITTTHGIFDGCNALTTVDVTGCKLNSATAFPICQYATDGVESLDVSAVVNASNMFKNNTKLTGDLDLTDWDLSSVTNASSMFMGCSNITGIDLSGVDAGNSTNANDIFNGCGDITSIDLSNSNFGNVTTASNMFKNCSSVTSIDLSGANFGKTATVTDIFTGCSSLTSLDLSGADLHSASLAQDCFSTCSNLTNISFMNCKVSKNLLVMIMKNYMNNINNDLHNLDTSKMTNLSSLTSSGLSGFIDFSGLDFSSVTTLERAFEKNCTSVDLSNTDLSSLTNISYMLHGPDGSSYSSLSAVDFTNATLPNTCSSNSFVFPYNPNFYLILNTSKVERMFIGSYSYLDHYPAKILVPMSLLDDYKAISVYTNRVRPVEDYTITKDSSGITVTPNNITLASSSVTLDSITPSATVSYTKIVNGNDIDFIVTQDQCSVGNYYDSNPIVSVGISYTLDTTNQTITFTGDTSLAPSTETYYLIALDNTRSDPSDSTKKYVAAVSGAITVTLNS